MLINLGYSYEFKLKRKGSVWFCDRIIQLEQDAFKRCCGQPWPKRNFPPK